MRTCLAALLIMMAAAGSALGSNETYLYLGGVYSAPVGPEAFDHGYKGEFRGTGGVGLQLGSALELVFVCSQMAFSVDREAILADMAAEGMPPEAEISIEGGDLSMLRASGGFRLYPARSAQSPIRPYIVILGGLAVVDQDYCRVAVRYAGETEQVLGRAASVSGFGFELGAGLSCRVTAGSGLFAESVYQKVRAAGTNFNFVATKVGVRLRIAR